MFYRTHSTDDTLAFGCALGEHLIEGDIVLLNGDLGAGKSVLARGLAGGCGVHEPMPSPTFTLMLAYRGRIPFYHFDLYRLDEPDAYYQAGLDEFVGGDGAAAIEWSECAELEFDRCIILNLCRDDSCDEVRNIELILRGLPERENELLGAVEKWSVCR